MLYDKMFLFLVDLSLVTGEDDSIYLAGMSLGLAPKQAKNLLDEEVHKWQLW